MQATPRFEFSLTAERTTGMQRTLLMVGLLLSLLSAAFAESEAASEAPSIAPTVLSEQRKAGEAPLVIDVRTAEEYAAGHIPEAVNIPFDQVAAKVSELDAPNGVALYCMVGPRARKGEAALLAAGYSSVLHIEGGMAAWEAAGLPVVRPE